MSEIRDIFVDDDGDELIFRDGEIQSQDGDAVITLSSLESLSLFSVFVLREFQRRCGVIETTEESEEAGPQCVEEPEEAEPECEFKPGDPVMVRDKDYAGWQDDFFAGYERGEIYPYRCKTARWKQCRRPTEDEIKEYFS